MNFDRAIAVFAVTCLAAVGWAAYELYRVWTESGW